MKTKLKEAPIGRFEVAPKVLLRQIGQVRSRLRAKARTAQVAAFEKRMTRAMPYEWLIVESLRQVGVACEQLRRAELGYRRLTGGDARAAAAHVRQLRRKLRPVAKKAADLLEKNFLAP